MASNRIGRRAAVFASAIALAIGSSAVLAQPGPGAGPGGGFGPGAGIGAPHGHGPGFGGGFGAGGPMAGVLAQVKTQLALDTGQQQMWDNAVAASKSARQSGRALMQQVHDRIKAELAKPEPDLAAVASMMDNAHDQGLELRKPARQAWLTFYGSLNAQQKAIVRDALVARMQRQDQMREQMRERFQQRFGTQPPQS